MQSLRRFHFFTISNGIALSIIAIRVFKKAYIKWVTFILHAIYPCLFIALKTFELVSVPITKTLYVYVSCVYVSRVYVSCVYVFMCLVSMCLCVLCLCVLCRCVYVSMCLWFIVSHYKEGMNVILLTGIGSTCWSLS